MAGGHAAVQRWVPAGGEGRRAREGVHGPLPGAAAGPGPFWAHVPAPRHPEDGARVTPGLLGGETRNGLLARSSQLQWREAEWPRGVLLAVPAPPALVTRRLSLGSGIPRPPEPPSRAEPLGRPVADPRTQAREGGDAAAQNRAPGRMAQAASSVPTGPGPPCHSRALTSSPCPDVTPVPRRHRQALMSPRALTSPLDLQELEPQSPPEEPGTAEATKRS